MEKHKKPVKIVCCGLNYFAPWKFRSSVIVDFSKPIVITDDMLKKYQEKGTKREATGSLLEQITDTLSTVKVSAPTHPELECLFLCRDLYTENIELSS